MIEETIPTPPAWLPGPLLVDLPDKTITTLDHGADGIVLVHFNAKLTAFRNSCLHQEMPIHAGTLTPDGILLCPWHNWCYHVSTGECLNVPGAELESFPVQVVDARVWVKVE